MAQPIEADDWIVPSEGASSARAPDDDWIVPPPSGLERARAALTPAPMQRVEEATARGMVEGFGDEPLGLSPQSEAELGRLGIFHEPGKGYVGPAGAVQLLNEAILRPSAAGVDAFFRALNAGAHGIAVGAGQVAREFGASEPNVRKLTGDIETAEQLGLTAPVPEHFFEPRIAGPRVDEVRSSPQQLEEFLGALRGMKTREEIDDFIRRKDAGEVAPPAVAAREARAGRPALPPPDDWVVPPEAAAPQPAAPTPPLDTAFPSFEEPGRTAPPASPPEIVNDRQGGLPGEAAAPPQALPPRTDIGPHVFQALIEDPRSAAEIKGAIDAMKAAPPEVIVLPAPASVQTGVNPQPAAPPEIIPLPPPPEGPQPGSREAPIAVNLPADVFHGAEHTAEPTPAQAEAGNYRKRHVKWRGLDIAIETEAGMERKGIAPNGEPWAVTLQHPYGYVKGSLGRDGDQVDIYLGPEPKAPHVFVVDQIDPATGKFDEHKALIGYPDEAAARAAYVAGFSDSKGEARLGAIAKLTADEFKSWLRSGKLRAPLAYSDPVAAAQGVAKNIGLNASDAELEQAARTHKDSNADLNAVAGAIDDSALAEDRRGSTIAQGETHDRPPQSATAHPTGEASAPAGGVGAEAQGAGAGGAAPQGVEPGQAERDRGEAGAVAKPPTPQVPAEPGTKYVLPSFVTAQYAEPKKPGTRDEAVAEPELAAPSDLTAARLTKLAKQIPSMDENARAATRSRIDELMARMEEDGRKIAEHCVETGGRFSVRG
jgi:hypothetical protein